MSKTRVFIYGSCVSRDTFEHFDPEQFELVEYVARQSVLSAYTKPVELMAPPTLESRFQQRMVTGDFSSSLRSLLSTHGSATDLVLVDLTDERLGAYLLPDGSMVTRSVELIESGAEQYLPQGTQHIAFGTQQHFDYWSTAMNYIGERVQHYMPQATAVLLDVAWAEWSESGTQTPDSFGLKASEANAIFRPYVEVAAQTLGAHVITMEPSEVLSGPHHPWGDAPFHYAEKVYLETVRRLTGTEGRVVWGPGAPEPASRPASQGLPSRVQVNERGPASSEMRLANNKVGAPGAPNFIIAGAQKGGTSWLAKQFDRHPEIHIAKGDYFSSTTDVQDPQKRAEYLDRFAAGAHLPWRGEATSHYFWHGAGSSLSPVRPDVPALIRETAGPDTRIILSLRDPVSRAIAAYWHHFSSGRFDLPTSMFQLPSNLGIVDLGFYRRHYEHWAKTLGPEKITVLLYDDLITHPKDFVAAALNALGLDAPSEFWDSMSGKGRDEDGPDWLTAFRKRKPITPSEIAVLLELYRDDIAFVENLVGRELPAWHAHDSLVKKYT